MGKLYLVAAVITLIIRACGYRYQVLDVIDNRLDGFAWIMYGIFVELRHL